ncbi:nucleoside deaminase [Aequorivita ciconiae]|nr:nucleoside deaminase [Aequorivita sp. H23M31]
MKRCLHLAELALENGNPPVGALLMLDGVIIGEGIESGKSSGDITNHAEILAIRHAIANGYLEDLYRASLYTTHEPCIMCSYVIRHHKISRIVYGTEVPYVGGFISDFGILTSEDVPKWGKEPQVISGVCQRECRD